jgi:cysteine desulfurase
MLYFDHNATAPLCEAARAAWLEAQERFHANPASLHRLGQRAERALENARENLASLLGCPPHQILWTSGATEAANAILASLAATSQGNLLLSPVEHPCVLESANRWFPGRYRMIPCDGAGRVDAGEVEALLKRGGISAVALMAANNETGVLQPWEQIAQICGDMDIPFVCDATQWVGRLPSERLGMCGFLFASTHKAGGPVGTGFLKIPRSHEGALWRPFFVGGAQEEGRRSGTQNVAGAAALVAALRDRQARMAECDSKTRSRLEIENTLKESVPGLQIVAEDAERLWNTISIFLPELRDCRRRWVVRLDAAGIAASSGAACSSGKAEPSAVLQAMGLESCADRVVRLSGGWDTTPADWSHAATVLGKIWAEEQSKD